MIPARGWFRPETITSKDVYLGPEWVTRWVRVRINGEDDNTSFAKREYDGWEIVKPDELPNLKKLTIHSSDCFYCKGCILMKLKADQALRNTEMISYVSLMNEGEATAEYLSDSNPKVPKFHQQEEVLIVGREPSDADWGDDWD